MKTPKPFTAVCEHSNQTFPTLMSIMAQSSLQHQILIANYMTDDTSFAAPTLFFFNSINKPLVS